MEDKYSDNDRNTWRDRLDNSRMARLKTAEEKNMVRIIIEMTENGEIRINGPLQQPVLTLGILSAAEHLVKTWKPADGQNENRPQDIVVAPAGAIDNLPDPSITPPSEPTNTLRLVK